MENLIAYTARLKANGLTHLWVDSVVDEMRRNVKGTVSSVAAQRLAYLSRREWITLRRDQKDFGLMWSDRVRLLNKNRATDFSQWASDELTEFLSSWNTNYYLELKGFPRRDWLTAVTMRDDWKPVPYLTEDMTLARVQALHWSLVEPKQVAYYPTLNHAIQGREVRTSLGKYLRKHALYFGLYEDGKPSDKLVKDFHDKIMRRVGYDAAPEVHFIAHDDKAGWVKVYEDGPSSCMQGESCVSIYAHSKSVLRLAYLVDPDDANKITARAIIREDDKKGYLRVYPDPENDLRSCEPGRQLLNALTDLGYGNRINLDGVLLDYVECDEGFVCPYIDRGRDGTQWVSKVYRDGKTYLLAGGDVYDAAMTSGYIEVRFTCDNCGSYEDEGDLTYIEHAEGHWCDHCRDRYYVHGYNRPSGSSQDWIRLDDAVFCESDHEWYLFPGEHNIFRCEESGDWFDLDDMRCTSRGWIHEDHAIALDVGDLDGNMYAHKHDVETLSDGRVVHEDMFDDLQAEIDLAAAEAEEAIQPTLPTIETKVEVLQAAA